MGLRIGRGGTGGAGDAERATDGAARPGGGQYGSGRPVDLPRGGDRGRTDAGDDYERADGDDRRGILRGAEAGPDYRITGGAAVGRFRIAAGLPFGGERGRMFRGWVAGGRKAEWTGMK